MNKPIHLRVSIRLRAYEPTDVDPLLEAVLESRKELGEWMAWCHPTYGRDDAAGWVESRPQAWGLGIERSFVIENEAGRMLGGCGLHRIDQASGAAEAGYWVRASATGRGVATAALRELIDWAFTAGRLHRLEAIVSTENAASQRVAEKAGGVREGVLKSRVLLNDRRHDALLYAFLRP